MNCIYNSWSLLVNPENVYKGDYSSLTSKNKKCPENLIANWHYYVNDEKGWKKDRKMKVDCIERTWRYCEDACETEPRADCTTSQECKFPFSYRNRTYNYCPKTDNIAPWCSTNNNGDWQFCSDTCPTSESLNPATLIASLAAIILLVVGIVAFIAWGKTKFYNSSRSIVSFLTKTSPLNISDGLTATNHQVENVQRYSDSNSVGQQCNSLIHNDYQQRDIYIALRNNEAQTTLSREQLILKSLSGDPTKIDKRRTINEQIYLLSYNYEVEIERSSFKTDSILGSGNFGTIFKGRKINAEGRTINTPVAIKTLTNKMDDEALFSLICEMKILSNLRAHSNIVNLIGCCTAEYTKDGSLWLLLEYCDTGDMKTFLIENRNEFRFHLTKKEGKSSELKCSIDDKNHVVPKNSDSGKSQDDTILNSRSLLIWLFGIANGMEYLSSENIMHGDLAARNVLLKQIGSRLAPKLADFGLSKRFYGDKTYLKKKRPHIPYKWMAVEYLLDGRFNMASDVWSYGVVVWELLSLGREPYPGMDYGDLLTLLQNGYTLPCPDEIINYFGDWNPQMLYSTLSKACFSIDPIKRASFRKIITYLKTDLRERDIL